MKSTKTQVTLNEFEAMALHKHYKKMAKDCKDQGLNSLSEEYYLMADKWLEIAIEIAKEKESQTL
jgi:hypothetical protein